MPSATTLEELKSFVEKIMKDEDIAKYEIQIEGSSERGENYLGEVTFFSVKPINNDKKYDLVMKTAKRSEELRAAMGVENAYKRESLMYSKVFPEIVKFLQKTNTKDKIFELDFIPKIYLICDVPNRESLIMENMKPKGFRHWNRRLPMDMNHVLIVLQYLGKYHAASMAMKLLRPEKFEEITQQLYGIWQEFMRKIDGVALFGSLFNKAVRRLEKEGKSDLLAKLKTVEDGIHSIIQGETPDDDKLVITHGDCWMNNFLFGYEKENSTTPSKICFVDFQLSSYETPVKDLSYFLYSACDGNLLNDFDLLLRKYHHSLTKSLHSLGCNVEDIFPFSRLMNHWRKYARFGLVLSTMIVKVQLLDADEAPDITEISETGANFADSFNRKFRNEPVYDERISKIFTHFGNEFL